MGFYKQSWAVRSKVMGDLAETAFMEVAQKNNWKAEHYGFDRSALPQFFKLPLFVRATPDFVVSMPHQRLIEAKGCGKGNSVKIKVQDIQVLLEWDEVCPTYLFIYDSSTDRYTYIHIQVLVRQLMGLDRGATLPSWEEMSSIIGGRHKVDTFPDSTKQFWWLDKENFTWETI